MNRNFNIVAASGVFKGREQGPCLGPPFYGLPFDVFCA